MMKAAGRLYFCVAYYLALLVFFLVSFCLNLVCFFLLWIPGSGVLKKPLRRLLQFLFRGWARFLELVGVIRLSTPEKTPQKSANGEIWVMNHPSILDGSYLLKFVTNGTCIYKTQIGSNPLYGSTAKLARHIPNVGGPDMVRWACEALERGEDLLVFPEGTRSSSVALSKFKPGFALIAKRSKAAINVLWVESPKDFMVREIPLWKVPSARAEVEISRIERIEAADCKSVREVLERVKACYAERAAQ